METQKRILIVDDEESLAFFLSEHLSTVSANLVVDIAHSATEAAIKIKDQQPDLIITDLRMPKVDGLQLLGWIRKQYPETRLILMTAYGTDEVKAQARRLQVYRYITKPFQVQDLVTIAQEALGEMALSGRGLLVLSDESFGAITVALEALRVDVGARCVLLSNSMGQLVTHTGMVKGLDTNLLLALLSNTFLATMELAYRFNEIRPAGFHYLEGQEMDVYAVLINDELFLSLLFDKSNEASRVGTVWFYARKMVSKLKQMLGASETPSVIGAKLEANFGASLTAELDNMLAELQLDHLPEKDAPPPSQMPLGLGEESPSDTAESLPCSTETPGASDDASLLDINSALERGLISPETAKLFQSKST